MKMSARKSGLIDVDLGDFDDSDIISELVSRITLWKHKPNPADLEELREALMGTNPITLDEQRFYQSVNAMSKTNTWNELINKLEK